VRPLAVADLPVILWCRATRLLEMAEFAEIAAMARKVIVDSAAMGDAAGALRRLQAARECCVLGDLAWTRLTRWREMLSQVFENPERLAQLGGIQQTRVTYAPGFETAARYLAAWMGAAIAAPVAAEAGPAETIRIELEGPGLRVELARHDDTLAVAVNELSHSTRLPRPTDYVLMREELSIIQADRVFDRTLASAAQ
jgi:glucose-6-phosphate dehydrogenase assembly protein OpcA